MTFRAFPSIDQFRNVIRNVKDHVRYAGRDENDDPIFNTNPLPTITFRGTVKLHGTNAAVVYNTDGSITYQSRSHEITPDNDNAGFAAFMSFDPYRLLWPFLVSAFSLASVGTIEVFGEWCGGNIQTGVAINGLPKMFVIFAIRIGDQWVDIGLLNVNDLNSKGIYNVLQFGSFNIDIDFERPEAAQNKLIEFTLAVEADCPAGRFFDKPNMIGEGIVWRPADFNQWNVSKFVFKTKGEAHSVSKVKTLAAVDVEKADSLRSLVDSVATNPRFEQGISVLRETGKPLSMESLGDFIRWVYNDIVKEDSDTIVASGFDPKKLGGPVANKARPWYINYLNMKG